jgi:hypothetical protein
VVAVLEIDADGVGQLRWARRDRRGEVDDPGYRFTATYFVSRYSSIPS